MAESSVGKEVGKEAVATTAGGVAAFAIAYVLKRAAALLEPTGAYSVGLVEQGFPAMVIRAICGLAAYGIRSAWTLLGGWPIKI